MLAHTPSRASQLRCLPHQQQQFKVPRFQQRHRRAHTVITRAQMGDLLDTMVTWGALAAGAGAVAYSLFYDRKQQKQQQQQDAPLFGPPDNMSWAVMGVVSCIPFFNYLVGLALVLGTENACMRFFLQPMHAALVARSTATQLACMHARAQHSTRPLSLLPAAAAAGSVLRSFFSQAFAQGALTSDNPRLWYWAAALYAMPLLRNGFELDWFSIAMVVLGAAHVQVGFFLWQRPWCGGCSDAYSMSMHTHTWGPVCACFVICWAALCCDQRVNTCCVDFPPCARRCCV